MNEFDSIKNTSFKNKKNLNSLCIKKEFGVITIFKDLNTSFDLN